jgi:hypothetical protein
MNENITAPASAPRHWHGILASKNNGYWFNKRTMRFFGSRILWQTLTPITSDRFLFVTREWSGFYDETPRYSVREWSPSNGVDTLGKFNGYETRNEAKKALGEYVVLDAVSGIRAYSLSEA